MNELKKIMNTFEKIDKDFWFNEKFSKSQALIDLILMCKEKDGLSEINNDLFIIKKGETLIDLKTLSERWKWDIDDVICYLVFLKENNHIDTSGTNKEGVFVLRIVNFEYINEKSNSEKVSHNTNEELGQK